MRFAIVARRSTATNAALAAAGGWLELAPGEALEVLEPGDVALGRLDVLPTLDGVDDGLWALGALAARGVRVLNPPGALLAAHDKLLTARILRRAGLPHPRTRLVVAGLPRPEFRSPVVVKPRFGSWGRDVERCDDAARFARHFDSIQQRSWFRAQGALIQDLVPPLGFDQRVVVAAGRVVGAVRRVAADGEWRTNVALGARREPAAPPLAAARLAIAAARTAGADLVGVDLLPDGAGGWTVVELNGAVELTATYALERDVFAAAAAELRRSVLGRPEPESPLAAALDL